MKPTERQYDAIVVGGGHNGLVAAAYLAKAGKTVLLLEAQGELGGATTSVQAFPDYEARLSRYSYLVSLLPDAIVADLGISFKTLDRSIASYTPAHHDGRDDGLLVATAWDDATADSFRRLTGSDREGEAWRRFYGEIAELARAGQMPQPLPLELYCHTLTDPTILTPELIDKGFHTLTLFGLHTPASLFDADPKQSRALASERALASLNQFLLDPIESVLAPCSDGTPAIEVKSPLDLENDIFLPRGNIFHRDLEFPVLDDHEQAGDRPRWGAETDDPHIFLAGAGARRGGGVSGIAGHNAAMAVLAGG